MFLNKDFYIFINNNEIQFSKFQLILNLFYIVCFIIASVASDYFVDEYGNTFSIPDSELKVSCVHNYVQGNRRIHYKISNGGCDLKYYDSKRCTMCGKVILGELIKTEAYEKCSHRFGVKE